MATIRADIKDNIPEQVKKEGENVADFQKFNSGVNNSHLVEANPNYNQTESEIVYQGKHNSLIVLGRDRPRGITSGYGGKGNSHSACIDIVAGMSGMLAREVNSNNTQILTDKSPELDAARIYISQRTDVDDNFNLADGFVGNAKTKSAIVVKADGVRVVAREGIKLITGTDAYNSQGIRVDVLSGIDLIAGNLDQDLQPIPKGYNLEKALNDTIDLVADLSGIVLTLVKSYGELAAALGTHTHIAAPLVGGPVSPPPVLASLTLGQLTTAVPKLAADIVAFQKNTVATKMNYIYPFGRDYINSLYNTTN
jgi:hypothetical protein